MVMKFEHPEDFILPGLSVAGSLLLGVLLYQAQVRNMAYDKASGLMNKTVEIGPAYLYTSDPEQKGFATIGTNGNMMVLIDSIVYGPSGFPFPSGIAVAPKDPLNISAVKVMGTRVWFDPKEARV